MSHAIKHCAEMEPGCPPNAGEGNGLGKNSLYQYNYTASSASTKKKGVLIWESGQVDRAILVFNLGEHWVRQRFFTNAYRSLR